jgi:hypothetical protein
MITNIVESLLGSSVEKYSPEVIAFENEYLYYSVMKPSDCLDSDWAKSLSDEILGKDWTDYSEIEMGIIAGVYAKDIESYHRDTVNLMVRYLAIGIANLFETKECDKSGDNTIRLITMILNKIYPLVNFVALRDRIGACRMVKVDALSETYVCKKNYKKFTWRKDFGEMLLSVIDKNEVLSNRVYQDEWFKIRYHSDIVNYLSKMRA